MIDNLIEDQFIAGFLRANSIYAEKSGFFTRLCRGNKL